VHDRASKEKTLESLGEKLRTTREARGLNYDQVSKDTNIAVRNIEALELEYFHSFPGEPYITGFIKTYGTYLDLDVQELISLYRTQKIREQPVPVEQLLKKTSPLPKIALITVIVLVIGGSLGGGLYYIFTRPKKPAVQAPKKREAVEYAVTGESLERRLYPGDTILVSIDNVLHKLELESLSDVVTIRTPSGNEKLELGQSININFNMDVTKDVKITAADFARNKADMGALIRVELNTPAASVAAAVNFLDEVPVNSLPAVPIFSSSNAYPFTLQSTFQGYCLFRWEILRERDRRDRNEQYFQKSDELNIQAQNGIRIWVSNAQAAKLQVIGGGNMVPVELGSPGEVVVADIKWLRDEDNRFRLAVVRLE
jgi:cytoskeletal protein RodZ